MDKVAFQDIWPEGASHCWGCGRNNEHGLKIKSYWEDNESICVWEPEEKYMAAPGTLCGGIIATIIDCHCLNTAVAGAYKAEGREIGTEPPFAYVTRVLKVELIKPTPTNKPLTLRAHIKEKTDKKIIVQCTVNVGTKEYARGEIVAVRIPPAFWGYK